tara:strand:+ start:464 stop:1567 length:1104 start_codon:yes stop_codon:yes gene_type:complete
MTVFGDRYRGKRVLITGHTGFKGSWLTLWLSKLGADVIGYSYDVPTSPSLFKLADVERDCDDVRGDIRDRQQLTKFVETVKPDYIFHLAAQPLVRRSYAEPIETLATNIMGTGHVLEAARHAGHPCTVVVVTSDKCYENRGWVWGYRENDPLGGHDPYSMSKAAAELVTESWRRSYFQGTAPEVRIASARAGNVIGGGDWAEDRLMTDCVAALRNGRGITVRNPLATRPWQHVLEPLSGYLMLAAELNDTDDAQAYAGGWNFGPLYDSIRPVQALTEKVISSWGSGSWQLEDDADAPHEAFVLALNCDKAHQRLRWKPVWGFDTSVERTVDWYQHWAEGNHQMRAFSLNQICAYEESAKSADAAWIG